MHGAALLIGRVYSRLVQSESEGANKNDPSLGLFSVLQRTRHSRNTLRELWDLTDKFVLVESRKTHSGRDKPLFFADHGRR